MGVAEVLGHCTGTIPLMQIPTSAPAFETVV